MAWSIRAIRRGGQALSRSNTTLAGTVSYRCSYQDGGATALVCAREKVKWSYNELWNQIDSVAGGLAQAGYGQGQVLASDVAATSASNVVLQLASAHLGVKFMSVESAEQFEKLRGNVHVTGAVMSSGNSFLAKSDLPVKSVMSEIKGKGNAGVTDRSLDFAYYGTDEATNNRYVYLAGIGSAGLLETTPNDIVCIASSTNHLFGMGGVISSFNRGAAAYLPDMGNLDLQQSTLVFTDSKNIDKVRGAAKKGSKLRGGVIMAEDFGNEIPLVLNETEDVEGTPIRILVVDAPQEKVMRELFDACKDTYYDFK